MKSNNLVYLDRSPFSGSDIEKIQALGEKQHLLYRWFRSERITQPKRDQYILYSGTRGSTPYAAYRIERNKDGIYSLFNQRTNDILCENRALDGVLDNLPDDFFYSL